MYQRHVHPYAQQRRAGQQRLKRGLEGTVGHGDVDEPDLPPSERLDALNEHLDLSGYLLLRLGPLIRLGLLRNALGRVLAKQPIELLHLCQNRSEVSLKESKTYA